MGAGTKIEWTDFTFNPWWGCEKVSPGCAHCYADTFAKRVGQRVWGKDAPRRFFGDAHWREPLKWNREAAKADVHRRVFCASMADVFEDRPDLVEPRARLAYLIGRTPNLDWLLLTKRPENIARLWITDVVPPNVWLGTTVEDQERADERIPKLLLSPAAVRFLSVEPMLGPVDLSLWIPTLEVERETRKPGEDFVDWVIVGGESGPGARPCAIEWIRDVVRQCREAGVPCFVKQLGGNAVVNYYDDAKRSLYESNGWEWPDPIDWNCDRDGQPPLNARVRVRHRDPKGGEPREWSDDLRVREFPKGGSRG